MTFVLLLNRSKEGMDGPSNPGKSDSTISSSIYHKAGVMCCASNVEGQECSQLYDYGIYHFEKSAPESTTIMT